MNINTFKDLIVWQKSMQLVREVYLLTENFPKSETFGLTSQMRRAAIAIPSNIAEGFSRKHRKEYKQFLLVAFGSCAEFETQLTLSRELNFAKDFQKLLLLLEEVQKMLNRMIKTLSLPKSLVASG